MTATLSSHILDTHLGKPAANITVHLCRVDEEQSPYLRARHITLAHGTTNKDGRVTPDGWDFSQSEVSNTSLTEGRYILIFDTQAYFDAQGLQAFYPQVIIDFVISDASHYHVPLLLSAHGYSTYRGS